MDTKDKIKNILLTIECIKSIKLGKDEEYQHHKLRTLGVNFEILVKEVTDLIDTIEVKKVG